jgi:putative NIF3 family GTP cyclohydrolase 1 type 2
VLPQALSYGADAFVTGEAKYNDFYDAEGKILLSVIGHYESEICTKDIINELLAKQLSQIQIFASSFDINPVN